MIHYRNMDAYHGQQKHRSLSSTTKKIGKQRIYQCFHVFIDLMLIWAVIRLQSTYFLTYDTCVKAAACVQQACVKKKKIDKQKGSICVQESFLWRLQCVREMMGH